MEDRYAFGFILAKAFNKPSALRDDLLTYRDKMDFLRRKKLNLPEPESDGSDVLDLFKRSGLTIIDEETRH